MSRFSLTGWMLNACYVALLLLVAPVLFWRAWTKGKYRTGWDQKLFGRVPVRNSECPCLWLHAVSVGEVLLLRPVIQQWQASRPHDEIVISVTTSTGYKVALETYPQLKIFYCPLDFTWAVHNALDRIRPTMLGLVELELWPNLITLTARRGIPVCVLNGRMGAKSFRGYQRLKFFFAPVLRKLTLIMAMDQASSDRFIKLGANPARVIVTGSIKFDGVDVAANQNKVEAYRSALPLAPDDIILLAGSTHEPEESILLDIYSQLKILHPRLRLLFAPRHAERFNEVAELITQQGFSCYRKSQPQTDVTGSDFRDHVILLDTLGELSIAWGVADLAYVGGSLENQRGGQNMLEPAAYGAAVLVGPNTWNFQHIMQQLIAVHAITQVNTRTELSQVLQQYLLNPTSAHSQGLTAQEFVKSQQGATRITIELMQRILQFPVGSDLLISQSAPLENVIDSATCGK